MLSRLAVYKDESPLPLLLSIKLTVPFIVLEEDAAQLPLSCPVRGGRVRHHPVTVQPHTVGLGVDPQALLQQLELTLA